LIFISSSSLCVFILRRMQQQQQQQIFATRHEYMLQLARDVPKRCQRAVFEVLTMDAPLQSLRSEDVNAMHQLLMSIKDRIPHHLESRTFDEGIYKTLRLLDHLSWKLLQTYPVDVSAPDKAVPQEANYTARDFQKRLDLTVLMCGDFMAKQNPALRPLQELCRLAFDGLTTRLMHDVLPEVLRPKKAVAPQS
jgi:hypothetical protein